MTVTERTLPFPKQLITLAIYDVIEKQSCTYRRDGATGDIFTAITAYGNRSEFAFSLLEDGLVTKLRISIPQPCAGLTRQGELRAVCYLADCVEQTLENELLMENAGKKEVQR